MGEVTWRQVFSVSWLIWWRATAGAAAIALVAGFGLGFVLAMSGLHQEPWAARMGEGVGYLAAVIWFPFVIRMALRKHYMGFRIGLSPKGVEKAFE